MKNARKLRDGTTKHNNIDMAYVDAENWEPFVNKPSGKFERKHFGLKTLPTDPIDIEKLGNDLVLWALETTSECTEQFPLSRLYSPYRFFQLQNVNDYFSNCLDFANEIIGYRRERAARYGDQDANVIMKTYALYNRRYKEFLDAKLPNDIKNKLASYTVVLQDYHDNKADNK